MTLFGLLMVAFVLSHFLLSSPPIRQPLAARLGETGFMALYSLVAILLLGAAIYVYRGLEPRLLWVAPPWAWLPASLLMLVASILFVGSLTPANKALAGVHPDDRPPGGVLRITRHPMMWALALWAAVHASLSGSLSMLLLALGLAVLALGGAAHQDYRKRRQPGGAWGRYVARTSYWPLGAQIMGRQPWSALWPGIGPVAGGLALWALLTYLHPSLMQAPAVPPWTMMTGTA